MAATVTLDDATVVAFRRGDETAVRSVYRQYSGLVMAVAMRVLGDRGLAEEAVQQAFLQAWRSAAGFEEGRDLAPWLATIARRVAIDVQRRESRRPVTALDDADPTDRSLVTLPPSEEQAWETGQVRLAIDALPTDERNIVRLQHVQGFTHQQIAEQLGIAVGTVKSRSFRAHRALAATLAHLREVAS
ncbi:MAG: sigma-70 family RNA polymerase sigma factor [Ilumatobacteraceae bacterium]